MTRRLFRRGGALLGLGVLSAAIVVVGPPRSDAATTPQAFAASNSAYGVRMQLTLSQFPVFPDVVDAGGPFAQGALNTLGTASALSAFPYPGEVFLGLPGLAAGVGPQAPQLINGLPATIAGSIPNLPPDVLAALSQVQLPQEVIDAMTPYFANAPKLPAYPFTASADGSKPSESKDLGFGTLDAAVANGSVTSSAVTEPGASGVSPAPTEVRSAITQSADGVVSQAVSRVSGFRIGPLILGDVRSLAKMARSADGSLTNTAEFKVSGVDLAGLSFDVTKDGFRFAGSDVPAPLAASFNDLLKSAGLELTILPEQRTKNSVIAAGLKVTRQLDLTTSNLGTGELSFIFGQASSSLTSSGDAPTSAFPDSAAVAPGTVAPGGSLPSTDSIAAGPLPTGIGAGTLPQGVTPAAGVLPVGLSNLIEPGFDADRFYLLFVAVVAAILVVGQLLRVGAFRARTAPTARRS